MLKNKRSTTKCLHHAGLPPASSLRSVQCKLQVQSSLARAVTVDSEVGTKTRMMHRLNVYAACKESSLMINYYRYEKNRIY